MLKRLSMMAGMALLAGCMTTHSDIGAIRAGIDTVGVKMLRPGARVRHCRFSVLGIPLAGADTTSLVADLLKLDAEADVVTKARVTTESVTTGVFNRICVELVGDLAREVSVVRLPALGEGHEHHH